MDVFDKTSKHRNILVAFFAGMVAFLLCFLIQTGFYNNGSGDYVWALRMARDIASNQDPYRYHKTPLDVPYPLTVAAVSILIAWLPDALAAAIFLGTSTALLAYGLIRQGQTWKMILFFSPSYLYALVYVQWSPLITAMAFFPSLLFLTIIKPQISLPMVISRLHKVTWRGVVILLGILVASLVVLPNWPLRFLSQIGTYEGILPMLVFSAGGPLLFLSLLRWKDAKGRLLLFMSLFPQRMFYDQLPLWLIPDTPQEMIFLSITSWLGFYLFFFHFRENWNWPFWVVISYYIPALFILVRKELLLKLKKKLNLDKVSV